VENVNGKFHDGIATVSSDGSMMVLTRSNYMGKNRLGSNKDAMNNTQLYSSVKDAEGKWMIPELLSFCDANHMYAHPAFSPDSKELYFSANLPNGRGGMDLHKVSYDGSAWGTPENLGEWVNTTGDEVFPSLKGSDSLFFSSDAMTSIGGLDILFSVKRDGIWANPEHLSYPINSAADDFGMIFNAGGDSGMLSSDRGGSDKLYNFLIFNPEIDIDGLVTDIDQLSPLDGVTIIIENLTDKTFETIISDKNGKFTYDLLPGKEYRIRAERDDYLDITQTISTVGKTSNETVDVVLEMKKLLISDGTDDTNGDNTGDGNSNGVYDIPNIHWDYNKWDIRPDAIPYLDKVVKTLKDNLDLKVQVQSHCDCRGSNYFNNQLSKKRAKAVVDYLVLKGIPRKLVKSKGFGERRPVNRCNDDADCSESEHQANRRTEFVITEKLD
jgi:outer membrane protein OmpA-like peptidoglycan-associated protein